VPIAEFPNDLTDALVGSLRANQGRARVGEIVEPPITPRDQSSHGAVLAYIIPPADKPDD